MKQTFCDKMLQFPHYTLAYYYSALTLRHKNEFVCDTLNILLLHALLLPCLSTLRT